MAKIFMAAEALGLRSYPFVRTIWAAKNVPHEFKAFCRAFHGSDQFSRVGTGQRDPTGPDPTREI